MSPEAVALARVLLDHHRRCLGFPCKPVVDAALVSYRLLCERAGLPDRGHQAGRLLREIAVWCHANGWPPLNALAVNHATRVPGRGYSHAPGCSLRDWPEEVAACLEFRGYPETV